MEFRSAHAQTQKGPIAARGISTSFAGREKHSISIKKLIRDASNGGVVKKAPTFGGVDEFLGVKSSIT